MVMILVAIVSCTSTNEQKDWRPRLYMGEPSRGAIVRGQDREIIDTKKPEFKDYACMSHKDLEHLFKACLEARRAWIKL